MTRYQGPEGMGGKFIRVEDALFSGPNRTSHDDLAKEDGIYDRLLELKMENPDTVDAGFFVVEGNIVLVRDYSQRLLIPLTPEARDRTIELFKLLSPDSEVIMSPDVPYDTINTLSNSAPQK